MKKLKTFLIIVVVAVVIKTILPEKKVVPKTEEQVQKELLLKKEKQQQEDRKEKIDWALTTFKELIKSKMNDPDSFKMIERLHDEKDTGNTVKLIIEYSGKNAFGGRVKNVAFGEYNIKANRVYFTNQPKQH